MAAPPLLAGAVQVRLIRVVPLAVAERSVGAPGTLALTSISKVSLTDPPLSSLAVTFTETVSTSAACGVPQKVRVEAVKVSHEGSAASSAFVAL